MNKTELEEEVVDSDSMESEDGETWLEMNSGLGEDGGSEDIDDDDVATILTRVHEFQNIGKEKEDGDISPKTLRSDTVKE
ncbi:hypothetical protein TanjilG_23714 [Lupinus angustifolius]|uniref:Uncharacterized protein n=1 Tax=Lupinus angustifolius TaxID=3871 RepID=A0A1J7FMX4_LUPAN|nr:hypothetical protein TanjilG_23714 [Lupinus angustifolius]